MKHNYITTQELKNKGLSIFTKGNGRDLIEDTINQLNKIKEPLTLANKEMWESPQNEEKRKKVLKLLKKKSLFLKQLISITLKDKSLVFVIEWSHHLKKLILIFRYNKEVIHISHLHSKGVLQTAPTYEIAKLITSHISHNNWRNLCYQQIKIKYGR